MCVFVALVLMIATHLREIRSRRPVFLAETGVVEVPVNVAGEAAVEVPLQMPAQADTEPTLPFNVTEATRNRNVFVKIGVLNVENRKPDEFWLEFDPSNQQLVDGSRLILPYIVSVDSVGNIPFFIHEISGCSSSLLPRGTVDSNLQTYIEMSVEQCQLFMDSNAPEKWKRWDSTMSNADQFRSTWLDSSKICHQCQAIEKIKAVRRFPTIPLKTVIGSLENIQLLDIDAQGLDVALILSLDKKALKKISNIKMECQGNNNSVNDYAHLLYETVHGVENQCSLAHRYLSSNGFRCEYDLNNCACMEFNLICAK